MSDLDQQLGIQAWLDDELPEAERSAVCGFVHQNADAEALRKELRRVKDLLAGNEPVRVIAESRDFYWSGIIRGIEREEIGDSFHGERERPWWQRLLTPAGALGAFALLIGMIVLRDPARANPEVVLAVGHEIETPLEETTSFSFRSEEQGMTVVWVADYLN